jgi:hypothetical protein
MECGDEQKRNPDEHGESSDSHSQDISGATTVADHGFRERVDRGPNKDHGPGESGNDYRPMKTAPVH